MALLYTIRGTLRRATRLVVVQMLYQMEQQPGMSAEETLETFVFLLRNEQQQQAGECLAAASASASSTSQKHPRAKIVDMELLEKLLFGSVRNKDQLDRRITPFLRNNWSIARLPILLTIILRTATYEMQLQETPYQVVINEYIEIAKEFFPDSEALFINGLLDGVSKQLKSGDAAGPFRGGVGISNEEGHE